MSEPHRVTLDTECYPDYYLVKFKSERTGKVLEFEQFDGQPMNHAAVEKILNSYQLISFNGTHYDMPMLNFLLSKRPSCAELKAASDSIIMWDMKGWMFERQHNLPRRNWDHIDLIEVAPGQASLKLYGGRLHSRKLQDLPIEPHHLIEPHQRPLLRAYCENDLDTNLDLFHKLKPQIDLRIAMSAEYGIDLRSKSDAQIAEAVIKSEVVKMIGAVDKPKSYRGAKFRYTPPAWLRFRTELLQNLLTEISTLDFHVNAKGVVEMPSALDERVVPLGMSNYRLGIGGLHSSEQRQAFVSDNDHVLIDRDVASYYPFIIIGQGLSPDNMRQDDAFQKVYRGIVDRRIRAKREGDTVVANSLKITINGSFGKFGSPYSILYSPKLLIQVTVTGQLSLLMLIESLELAGISVVSGNTDGIVIRCPRDKEDVLLSCVHTWEQMTGFETEETRYKAIFSRDVNNYIALGENGKLKGKGAFADVGLQKNPNKTICVEAVQRFLKDGTPIEHTVRSCLDISKFVSVRRVTGGAVQITATKYDNTLTPGMKRDLLLANGMIQVVGGPLTKAMFDWIPDGSGYDVETAYRMFCGEDSVEFIGKVVRFYIGHNSKGPLFYKTKNKKGGRNTVPDSEGAVPMMELPDEFPTDVNHEHYIREAHSILADLGVTPALSVKLHAGENADLF